MSQIPQAIDFAPTLPWSTTRQGFRIPLRGSGMTKTRESLAVKYTITVTATDFSWAAWRQRCQFIIGCGFPPFLGKNCEVKHARPRCTITRKGIAPFRGFW
jgi:hypothetical protein